MKDVESVEISSGGKSVKMSGSQFEKEMKNPSPETIAVVKEALPKPPPLSSEARDVRQLWKIKAQERKVDEIELQWRRKADDAKAWKGALDAAQSELRRMIRDGEEGYPLLAEPAKDAWRELPLDVLGLPAVLVKKITEWNGVIPLETIGELVDFVDGPGGNRQVSELTPSQRDRFTEAMEKFWEEHPDAVKPSAEEPNEPES